MSIGVTTRGEMRRHLQTFVADNFPDVSLDDAAFFPSDKTIGSCMYRSIMKLRYHNIDEMNVVCMVDRWKNRWPGDFFYYRPKTCEDDVICHQNPEQEEDFIFHIPNIRNKQLSSSLLFIHISEGQRELLRRYEVMPTY